MDYVYICRAGENEELRYSLRSIEKNVPDANVWIFGDAPSWYVGNIKKTNSVGAKYSIARRNLLEITNHNEVSDSFVLMNDDFFIMKPLEYPPIWNGGLLKEKIKHRLTVMRGSRYNDMLQETYHILRRMGVHDILDYELHVPLQMTKEGLHEALVVGGLWRSVYGNMYEIGGEQHKDVKVYKNHPALQNDDLDIHESIFLSTTDDSFMDIKNQILGSAFPDKSRFEK